ncbi:protein TIC 20-II, chloroplastic [Syzygium oleosum]|uniref:protein TIC 20-II, chloroplastic n=1 Tax=Syzygium oleosum TaxID=219896 RepID=UPI0024BA0B95|nr:protein TIC 20-II, chloroplastic [Syzygium oleosum]
MATASAALLRLSLLRRPPAPNAPSKPRHLPPSSLTPSLPPSLSLEPRRQRPPRPAAAAARMSYSPTPATDRLISAAAYTLPFFNSLQYGRFLFLKYPSLSFLFDPLLPLLSLYKSVPYASFVAFFALYLGVVRNPSFSHYVRFNAMQAVTLDVLLVLPLLLQRIFNPGRAGLGFRVMVWGHNVVFVFSALCFLYSLASSILGRTPYLPFVADAAGRQL